MTELWNRIENLENIAKNISSDKYKHNFLDSLFVFMDNLDTYVMITDPSDKLIYANQNIKDWLERVGISLDEKNDETWWEQIGWAENPSDKNIYTHDVLEQKKLLIHRIKSRKIEGLVYLVVSIPLKYNGVAAVLSLIMPNVNCIDI